MRHYWYWMFPSLAWAAGTAHIYSHCPNAVWYASVPAWGAPVASHLARLPAGGYSEQYLSDKGVSLKVGLTEQIQDITQFEYTWNSTDGKVSYDLSNIDGNPFAMLGAELTPSVPSPPGFPSCLPVVCPAGQSRCEAAYNMPNDVRTLVCPEKTDLTLTLCPNRTTKRSLRPHVIHRHASGRQR